MMQIRQGLHVCAVALLLSLTACGGGSTGSGGGGKTSSTDTGSAGSMAPGTAETPAVATGVQQSSTMAAVNVVPTEFIESKVATPSDVEINPFKIRAATTVPTPAQIMLAAPLEKAVATAASRSGEDAAPTPMPTPTQIGFARSLTETASVSDVSARLGWTPSARGGKVAALRFQSPGAKGVRVGVLVRSLPLGGVVRFSADGSDAFYEVSTQEIQTVIQRNLDAGDTSDAARTYWSPNLGGSAITVEFELPPDVPADTVQVAIPTLSHVFVGASELSSIEKVGQSGSCNVDVSCSADYSAPSKSVAVMDFVKDGSSYVCTGTLLNDVSSSGTPYFLSANHCIPTQTVATTLWTYWFYKAASCNSTQVDASATWMRSGATLLYASSTTDTSFMRLNGPPPAGALYAASSPAGLGDPNIYGVHHPMGDLQKYSVGTSSGPAGPCATCAYATSSNFWKVQWSVGTTEGGSSGSGLFNKVNGKDYLIGQLYGGAASCGNQSGADYYGRFDLAYNSALYKWLGGTPTSSPTTPTTPTTGRSPIYRFYNNKTGTHFYTSSANERNQVMASYSEYTYEGTGFYAQAAQAGGNTPVYRFFNTKTGAHFYTVSPGERDEVRTKLPQYTYEGIAWYVYTAAADQSSAMHRFYNTTTQAHFYTISNTEAQSVQSSYPQYKYEGVAYHAWTSP